MKGFCILLGVISVLVFTTNNLYAQASFGPGGDCRGVVSTPNFNANETRSRFYIDETFGQDLTATTTTTNDDGNVSEFELRAVIKMAAEHWNMESRGAFLEYGGTFNYTGNDANYYCPTSSEPTRIYINFQPECQDNTANGRGNANGAGCVNSLGKIWPITNCTRAVRITIYGSTTNDNSATMPGTGLDWSLTNGVRDLERVMVHELGHALNLGHPFENTVCSTQTPCEQGQTCGSGSCTPFLNNAVETVMRNPQRYLRYWDQECVAVRTGGRSVRPWVLGIATNGTYRPKKEVDPNGPSSEKGALANGYWDGTTKTGTKYAAYHSTFGGIFSYIADLGTDGYLFPYLLVNDWSPNPAHYSSTVFSLPEDTPNWDNQMTNYLWGASTTTTINPPNVKLVASNNNFVSTTVLSYLECQNSTCTTTSPLTSNIPLTTAYDPISQRTVFVSVDTSNGRGGQITVHPGIYSSTRNKLRSGSQLSTSVSFAVINNNVFFPSDGTTQAAVGVACADQNVTSTHNCLLAWVDRGRPEMALHYTYFRVNTGTNSIDWFDRAVIRGGANSVSHISAGFFADKLWVGYRDLSTVGRAMVMTNDLSGAFSWSSAIDLGATSYVADPPSFGYVPQLTREAGIFWTEVD